jgi:hypothetical protein
MRAEEAGVSARSDLCLLIERGGIARSSSHTTCIGRLGELANKDLRKDLR